MTHQKTKMAHMYYMPGRSSSPLSLMHLPQLYTVWSREQIMLLVFSRCSCFGMAKEGRRTQKLWQRIEILRKVYQINTKFELLEKSRQQTLEDIKSRFQLESIDKLLNLSFIPSKFRLFCCFIKSLRFSSAWKLSKKRILLSDVCVIF